MAMNKNRYQKIIEVNGGEKLSLPIVKFPPFKLRAAMVEKDPVIWLHLLETYVTYFQYLMSQGRLEQIDESTYENLCIFVRSYLHELSDEEGKLLSLGMNHDVLAQLKQLKCWVFAMIKNCGLLHLQISGESLWNLVRIYVGDYPDSVRSLVDGSLKPSINTQKAQINRTYQLHHHLKNLVESSKFTRVDLKSLEALLTLKSKRPNKFADQFLTVIWAETLESWFKKQSGKLYELSKKLGILTYLSSSESKIISLIGELNISSLETLRLYPLFGAVIMNESFGKYKPGLGNKLPFLDFEIQEASSIEDSFILKDDDLKTIEEVFPHMTTSQIKRLLQANNGNVEKTINAIFEDPSIAEELTEQDTTSTHKTSHLSKAFENELTRGDVIPKQKNEVIVDHVPDELRNKTLTRALELLYQKDEDERDDTYDDAEVQREGPRTEVSGSSEPQESQYDKIEGYLWQLLKENKKLFERSSRGSSPRKEMKAETSWSDEQIEGWARMLERSPQRARLLEEKYIFKGNVRMGKRSFVQNKHNESTSDGKEDDTHTNIRVKTESTKSPAPNPIQKKRQNARNEKNKSSKANHNRKSGHDKKLSKALP